MLARIWKDEANSQECHFSDIKSLFSQILLYVLSKSICGRSTHKAVCLRVCLVPRGLSSACTTSIYIGYKILTKATYASKELLWVPVLGHSPLWQRELEGAGHITSVFRKDRSKLVLSPWLSSDPQPNGAQSIVEFRSSTHGIVLPAFTVILSTSLTQSRESCTGKPKTISMVIVNSLKLAIKTANTLSN